MIETFELALPHGITLSCRAAGPVDAPRLVFLHGFPEAAFVWDDMLAHFGDRYRCIAPNLRGYERSSAPDEVEAYRPRHLVADIAALVDALGGGPLEALVAHDWGGALAWNFAVQHPARLKRLVIINAPHPGTFLRELQHNPAQQVASAYMNRLREHDAEAFFAEDDFRRLWQLFTGMGAAAAWLDEAAKAQYRAVWQRGLRGPINYYRASPMFPPTAGDASVMTLGFPPEFVTVKVPTTVLWAEQDRALLPGLLDGLEAFVPDLRIVRFAQATHWVVHEEPQRVAEEIAAALAR